MRMRILAIICMFFIASCGGGGGNGGSGDLSEITLMSGTNKMYVTDVVTHGKIVIGAYLDQSDPDTVWCVDGDLSKNSLAARGMVLEPVTGVNVIRTRADLEVISGNSVLANDIDLGGNEWTPISAFNGIFNGGGHKITGLKITTARNYIGLFGKLGPSPTVVRDLSIDGEINVNSTGATEAGFLAGSIHGTSDECQIENVSVSGDASIELTISVVLGGVIGSCNASLKHISFSGSVSAKGGAAQSAVGGVAGNIGTSIASYIKATGVTVTGEGAYMPAGGLYGRSGNGSSSTTYAYTSGSKVVATGINSVTPYAGGIIGEGNGHSISQAYSTIEDIKTEGTATLHYYSGGIGGNATITSSVASNKNISTVTTKGIASRVSGGTHSTGNYALEDIVMMQDSSSVIPVNDSARDGTAKTAAELEMQSTYEALGWDFTTVWKWDNNLKRPVFR